MKSIVSPAVLVIVSFLIDKVRSTAIVHGTPVGRNEFPFMAALGWRNNLTSEEDYLCGGVLIAPSFVLTAAHCVFFQGRVPDIIKIGGYPLNFRSNEMHTVKRYFLYPEYNTSQVYNDIAILQLSSFSRKRLAIWWSDAVSELGAVTAIGYGTTEYAGIRSKYLQKVDLSIVPNEVCHQYFKRKRKIRLGIQPSHICAGDPEGQRDTCQGDSGGPLLQYYRYVIGITSVGQACSGVPPAIYTRVSFFRDWIRKIITIG